MAHITVFGAGSWGTAMANVAAGAGHDVCLWSRRSRISRAIAATGRNPDYLREIDLAPSIYATSSIAEAAVFADRWILAVPSQALRGLAEKLNQLASTRIRICNLAKGLEITTGKPLSQVCHESLPRGVYSTLSGPSHAEEVALGRPTAVVVASCLSEEAFEWQVILSGQNFRVYTSDDVTGVEIGGAVKNVIAIAAGMAGGMEMGDNTLAALVSRGLAEIMRLGAHLGAHPITFAGLAGVGDLMATCYSELSRNYRLGRAIAGGDSPEEAMEHLGQVAEGYYTVRALKEHAERYGVDMPISMAVYRVLYEQMEPSAMLEELLLREPKPEVSPEIKWAFGGKPCGDG
ncbi:MAG: NAD(P)-dependent glycerol-3-phosphate dehydrogenase [Synergistales bacterium]|nr:NAD(P)-dependent glycerol-3-phosphate dehydrogenase [Synergistales bacterium]